MPHIHASATNNNSIVVAFPRPRIECALDCEGFYIIRGDHGWLCGDRRQALREFELVERIERLARP